MGGLTWDIRHGNAIDVLRAMACECGAAVEPCTVLDPFNGSGTSGVVAVRNNRRYIGIDLSSESAEMSRKRLADDPIIQEMRHCDSCGLPIVGDSCPCGSKIVRWA